MSPQPPIRQTVLTVGGAEPGLLMVYSLPVALAASQINGALWTPVAARNYLREKLFDWPFIGRLVMFGLVGMYFGAQVVVSVYSQILQRVVGILILSLVLFVFLQRRFGIESTPPSTSRIVASCLAFPLGFYEAFFGSGNGIFTSAMLAKARGFDLITTLGYYYVVSFTWCAFAAYLYLHGGYGELNLIVPSAVGAAAGAYLGSAIGSRKGAGFVKLLFVSLGGIPWAQTRTWFVNPKESGHYAAKHCGLGFDLAAGRVEEVHQSEDRLALGFVDGDPEKGLKESFVRDLLQTAEVAKSARLLSRKDRL